jgi:CRISPR/Cas system-associated exonuclease Cas4 (RecB family)
VRDPNVLNERVGQVTFLYLNGNVRVSKTPTEKDYAEAKNWALKSMDAIRTGQFAPEPDQFKCPGCEFNRICPFRAGRK